MPSPRRTFSRTELTRALAAVDRPDIAEGLYARRMSVLDDVGPSALALDFDDPGDLGVLIAVITRLLGPDEAIDFAVSLELGRGEHPDGGGLAGAWWPRWRLDEPTRDEWADERRDCGACTTEEDSGQACPIHEHPPWDLRHRDTVALRVELCEAARTAPDRPTLVLVP